MQNKGAAQPPPAFMEELQTAISLAKEAGRAIWMARHSTEDLQAKRAMICTVLKEKFPHSTWAVNQPAENSGVQIGLSQEGQAVLGVNYFPGSDTLYWAVRGQGAYRQIGDGPLERLQLLSSGIEVPTPVTYVENVALAICRIAEGSPYNVYFSKAGAPEDFLAVDILLSEAGGILTDWRGRRIDYRQPNFEGIIACSNRRFYPTILAELETK